MFKAPLVSIGDVGVNTGDGNIGVSGQDMAAMYAAQAQISEEANAQTTKIALLATGGIIGSILLVFLIYQLLK